LEQARKEAGRLRSLVDQGLDPIHQRRAQVEAAQGAPTVLELIDRLLRYLEEQERRQGTLREYRRLAEKFILPRLGKLRVSEVTSHHIERLHGQLKATPYQANRLLAVLSRAFNLAERWGWRQPGSNPTRHIDRFRETRRGAKKGAMLSPSQIVQLLQILNEEEKADTDPFALAAIRFAFWTGWRMRSEILKLRWMDIDLATGQARLLRTKTADEEHRSLPDEAVQLLAALPRLPDCPWVFPGKHLSRPRTTVRNLWGRVRERAGLTGLEDLGAFRIHDLRHNAVSWDVSRGVSLKVAGANVGHKSVQATEIYSHFAPDHLRAAANARSQAMKEAAAALAQEKR
jgi:integrase